MNRESSVRGELLAERATRYTLLATALAGRPLTIALSDAAKARTWSDGTTVFVAQTRLDDAWLDISLQALLVRNDALQANALRKLIAQPARARAYLAFELARAVANWGNLLPRSLLTHPAIAALPAATSHHAHSLEQARVAPRAARDMAPAWGVILPGLVLRAPAAPAHVGARPAEAHKQLEARGRDEAELESSRVIDRFRAPFASPGLLGQLLAKLLERRPSAAVEKQAEPHGAGAEIEVADAVQGRSARSALARRPTRPTAAEPAASPHTHRHPEWDVRRARYLSEWVHVAEVEPHPDNAREDYQPPRRGPERGLRRAMGRLCLGYEAIARQSSGSALDIDALVRLRVDALGGHVADERIYQASLRVRHELSVLVLLDITGSTAERDATGQTVFERQLALALCLTRVLHDVGNRVACYGFHGWGRKLVRFQRIIPFGERPGARMIRRAGLVSPVGYSRLGAALRHGGAILRRDGATPHKLLMMISDGIAYDQGYEALHARADTQCALGELRAGAIACVCLSVSEDRDARAQSFSSEHYLSVPTLAGREHLLAKLLERAVRGVNRRCHAPGDPGRHRG
jgi:nitric oxide reductase NorD protein